EDQAPGAAGDHRHPVPELDGLPPSDRPRRGGEGGSGEQHGGRTRQPPQVITGESPHSMLPVLPVRAMVVAVAPVMMMATMEGLGGEAAAAAVRLEDDLDAAVLLVAEGLVA